MASARNRMMTRLATHPMEGEAMTATGGEVLVRDVMTCAPVVVSRGATIDEARRLLADRAVRHLPVAEHGRLYGMISDRDVRPGPALPANALGWLADALGARRTRVRDVMAVPVHWVAPDQPLVAAVRLLLTHTISAVPVVEHRHLVGIVTSTDCLALLDRVVSS